MSKLPYSRAVNVTVTRDDNYPARRGFGVALLLSSIAVAGVLDATHRTKVYGSMEEIAADHAASTDVYKAAEEAFSQDPRPIQIKVGFITAATPSTLTASQMKAQLDSLYDADPAWYFLCISKELRDIQALDGLIEWTEAKNRLAILDSNAVATETVGDTTSVAGRNKNLFERSSVFYQQSANNNDFPGFSLAATLGTFNFDDADSHYTAKWKELRAVNPVDLPSSKVQAITGFTPALGQSVVAGNMANCLINIGERNFVVEGSTLTPNVFIDEIHSTDWIIARTEEEMLGVMLNNKRVPMTDAGMQLLASGPRTVMRQATRAGIIAQDLNPQTGEYEPAVEIIVPSVFDIPASQRKNRIAPPIRVRFRYAGAVHYTTIDYRMAF